MKCEKCGSEISIGRYYCDKCGNKMKSSLKITNEINAKTLEEEIQANVNKVKDKANNNEEVESKEDDIIYTSVVALMFFCFSPIAIRFFLNDIYLDNIIFNILYEISEIISGAFIALWISILIILRIGKSKYPNSKKLSYLFGIYIILSLLSFIYAFIGIISCIDKFGRIG